MHEQPTRAEEYKEEKYKEGVRKRVERASQRFKTRITSRRTVLSGTFEFTYQDSRLFTDGKRYRHKHYGRCQPASKLGSRRNFIFFQSVAELDLTDL